MKSEMRQLPKINNKKLKEMLKLYNKTRLSELSGVSYNTIRALARPSRNVTDITAITAYKIARAIGLSTDAFIRAIYNEPIPIEDIEQDK